MAEEEKENIPQKDESLKAKTKKGIYWTFFNQLANNGLQFVVGIIMARMLSPEDYGITALPAVFIAVASIFIGGGLGSALIRKKEISEADLSTAFYYSIIVGVVCYLLIFIAAPWIADFYDTLVLEQLIRVTALTFLWSPLSTPQSVTLTRKLDFKTPTRIAIVTKIVGAIAGIVLAYLGYGLWSLVIMGVVSSLMQTAQMWLAVKWVPKEKWNKESFKYLWGYGNKMMFSGLLDTLYTNITPVVVGKYYSKADLGIYNRAQGYSKLPSQQATSVIQRVTFPVLSKMQDDEEGLAKNYRKMLKVSAFVIFPVMLMLSALARPFVITLVTEKWEASVPLLQIICFSMMWYPIHAINLNLLQVKGRSDLFFRLEVIKKISGLSIMCATLPFGLITFCYGRILSSMISLVINTYYTGKLINVGYWKQMGDILPIFGLSVLMFLCIHGVNLFVDNLILQLIIGGIVGTIVYIGLAYIFKFSQLEDVKYMLKLRK